MITPAEVLQEYYSLQPLYKPVLNELKSQEQFQNIDRKIIKGVNQSNLSAYRSAHRRIQARRKELCRLNRWMRHYCGLCDKWNLTY